MIKAVLTMLRPSNLILLLLTQFFIRFFIIHPVYEVLKIQSSFHLSIFIFTVLATVLVAASGYIINDYFDQNIDAINKPYRLHIHQYFTKQSIINLHLILNVIAVALATFAAWKVNHLKLSFIFIVASGMLWFYSESFKKMFFVGNMVIAFFTAFAVLIPVLFEMPFLLESNYSGGYDAVRLQAGRIIMITITGYCFFAFICTLIREIVKDMEDMEADAAEGASTLPIVLGLQYSKFVVLIFWTLLIAALAWLSFVFSLEYQFYRVVYIVTFLILPGILGIYLLIKSKEAQQFKSISFILKAILFFGILSMPVFYFLNLL